MSCLFLYYLLDSNNSLVFDYTFLGSVKMKTVIEKIAELKIIPVVKIERIEDAVTLASALISGGIPAAEVTFRTHCAAEAIQAIANEFPDMLVGAGTVLNPEQADAAIAAGAKFIVSPGFDHATVQHCIDKGIPIFPGCVTASEVQQAANMGLTVLKFFPAEQTGGLSAIKSLAEPFSKIRWMPTGGINLTNIKSYLNFKEIIACGGSYMVSASDIEARDWERITDLCRQTIELIQNKPEPKIPSAPLFTKMEKTFDVITMGEVLLRLSALPDQRICNSSSFTAYIGGSELNVSSGVARLGLKAGIITCLPDNDMGKYAYRELRRLGVSDELISYDFNEAARLGLYYFESGAAPRKPKVVYDRANSSFCKLDLSNLPQTIYSDTRLFHISGITLALPQVRNTAIDAIRRFKAGGALISLDVNYRANLWNEQTAYQVLSDVLSLVDILFVSEETSRRMFQMTGTLEEIMRSYHDKYGVKIVATTRRKVISPKEHVWNSIIYSAPKDAFFTDSAYDTISVIDRIGSGDAYDAGVLYGLLEKGTEQDMVIYGNAMAAFKCTIPGDLPDVDKEDIEKIMSAHKDNDQSEMNR